MTTLAATTTPPSGSEDGLIGADPMASPERPGSCLAARHGQAVCTNHDIQRLCDLPADAREQLRALGLYPAVAQLCESERQFRDLFDRGPVAYHEVDLDGVVRRVNRAECDLLGVEAGAMLDRPIFEFISPEEQSQSREALKKKLSGQQAIAPFLREYVRSDGRHLTLEIHELLIKDHAGTVTGLRSALLDVTERTRTEAALKESEQRYRMLFEHLPTPAFVCEAESFDFLAVNATAVRHYGYSRGEFLSMNLRDLQPLGDLPTLPLETGDTPRSPEEARVWEHKRRDGTLIKVDVDACAQSFRGQPAKLLVVRDVTELERAKDVLARTAKELARSNSDLEQFAYVASHDLQEPLRMVSSYTQLLARRYKGRLDSDADEFIAFAVDGAVRMQRLINDLLAFSRVTTKGHDLEPVDAAGAFQQALANLKAALDESSASVTCDPLPVVVADARQIEQLLQNLIGNALKFRREDPPRIHMSAGRCANEWLFSIRDNGIGIESRHLERIFVIFKRLHNSAQFPGTGIGLALCKKIVERHGGRIWVTSQVGEGSTFYFTLPAEES